MPDLVTIVIPAFNQLAYCRLCIESVQRNTRPPYRLVLVDNGSTDGVGEYFDSVPNAIPVHTGRNLGFPAGVNRGLAHAEGHVLLLNSDTIVPSGWLERLEAPFCEDAAVGMTGPVSNCVSGEQRIEGLDDGDIAAVESLAHRRAAEFAGQRRDTARLVGFCALIRDTTFRKVGLLDEDYGIGNFEDDDYCLRVRLAGYRLSIADDAFVFHFGSRSFAGMGLHGEEFNALIRRNEALFLSKWRNAPLEQLPAYHRARLLAGQAQEALEQGDAAACLRLYRDALALNPVSGQLYCELGQVMWRLGDPERARAYLERALQLEPGNPSASAWLKDINTQNLG